MVHGEKFFVIEDNQAIWETYLNNIMETWDAENKERLESQTYTNEEKEKNIKKLSGYSEKGKDDLTPYKFEFRKKKMSVQQYKPIVLEFEKIVSKSFHEVNGKDVKKFRELTKKKNKLNHLNAFLLYCVNNGIIKNRNKDFLILLLPEIYRNIGKIIAQKGETNSRVLLKEHKKILKCPFCGREKDALVENWLLIQISGEKEKYLACRECEGEDGKY